MESAYHMPRICPTVPHLCDARRKPPSGAALLFRNIDPIAASTNCLNKRVLRAGGFDFLPQLADKDIDDFYFQLVMPP
jgi:hypothetical protein